MYDKNYNKLKESSVTYYSYNKINKKLPIKKFINVGVKNLADNSNIFWFEKNLTFFFYLKKNTSINNNIKLFWFGIYLSFFLKHYTSTTITWQFLNFKIKTKKKIFIKLWRLSYKKSFLKNFYCSSWFYFYLLLSFYCFKDIRDLAKLFTKIISKHPLKHHKRLFYLTGSILTNYLDVLSGSGNLKGFRLYFKGKLGKKGSVKKSTIYFSGGRISYTNKMLRYNYKRFLIPTETGVVGCYLSVYF